MEINNKSISRAKYAKMDRKSSWMPVRKYKLILFGLPFLLGYFGLLWLAVGIFVLAFLFTWFRSFGVLRRSQILSSFFLLLGVCILSVLVRLFVVEIYNIPSSSMENALFPGDNILVSKLNYGPRLPQSSLDIPWFNLFFGVSGSVKSDSLAWNYRRLGGFSKVKHNDIVVFKGVNEPEQFVVKRCIGLPGERITIKHSKVFLNEEKVSMPTTQKKRSRIWIKDLRSFLRFADSSGIVYGIAGNNMVKEINLTENKKKELLNLALVDSISHVRIREEASFGHQLGWTPDNLGPLLIPSSGSSIKLNSRNFTLYHQVINRFERTQLSYNKGTFFVGGKPAKSYTFKYNYYFMIGDNWSYSKDSRFWGFVPEMNIVGKNIQKF